MIIFFLVYPGVPLPIETNQSSGLLCKVGFRPAGSGSRAGVQCEIKALEWDCVGITKRFDSFKVRNISLSMAFAKSPLQRSSWH